jgi:transposase
MLACALPASQHRTNIISSAVVTAIGNGAGFKQGRDFAAWLGLIPKQESTGDRTILGKISKRGNKYVRTLFVQAAHGHCHVVGLVGGDPRR